jgi:sugar lactone lactonase YvrE
MLNRKIIVQVYSGKEPLDFNDFVRGTLRLLNYVNDKNIDLKLNIQGSLFENYINIKNYSYYPEVNKPIVYFSNNKNLISDLDSFVESSEKMYVLTSAVYVDRSKIYNNSYLKFNSLVEFKPNLYTSAETIVRNNLLKRIASDNLNNGYNVIYVYRDINRPMPTTRDIYTLTSQIKTSINFNADTIILSNSIGLKNKIYTYIETKTPIIDESIVDLSNEERYINIENEIMDFIILLKANKIYRFTDTPLSSINTSDNIYDTALNIQSIIGNLKYTDVPLTYVTSTLVSSLNLPSGIVSDKFGNLYIADTMNHRICKRSSSGILRTFAGSLGISGYINGSYTDARFNSPTSLAIDRLGNIYVADTGNNAIRIISTNLVGSIVNPTDGLQSPRGVAVDTNGSVYISDTGNNRICMITSENGLITLAGGYRGYLDETGLNATFNSPTGITVDFNKTLYVTDTGNHVIRKITRDKVVTTLAGNGIASYINGIGIESGFNMPTGITIDKNGTIYVSDTGNNTIRNITQCGRVISLLGKAERTHGSLNGIGNVGGYIRKPTSFYSPSGITADLSNNIFIADTQNNMIRKIELNSFNTTKISAVSIQTRKIIESPGVAMTLGPTLSAPPPNPNTIIYGKQWK